MKPIQIRTKNHTASQIKGKIFSNKRVIFRLGSKTETKEIFPKSVKLGKDILEINTVEACSNSSCKIKMKTCFDEGKVKTAEWAQLSNEWDIFPCIVKHKFSSKGNGIYLISSKESLDDFINSHDKENYIVEKFYNYTKEYRLHVTKDGCFYTCRKLLKNDADPNNRWHRHDTNSIWVLEENPSFDKPKNWDEIVKQCVNALNSVGLDIGACDVKVQTEKGKKETFTPDFIVLEINSAPALGEITAQKYIEKLQTMV